MVTLGKIDEPEFTLNSYSPESSDSTDFSLDVRSLGQDVDESESQVLERLRDLIVESQDPEQSVEKLVRKRDVFSTASDTDEAVMVIERFIERQLVRDLTTEEREVIRKVVEERDVVKGPLS